MEVEGVVPTAETIRAGKYPLVRPFIMVTNGESGRQSRLIRMWFEYVRGDEGRSVIGKMGLVPAD